MGLKHTHEYQRWMLQKSILFDDADLEANWQGYMTHSQRALLRRNLRTILSAEFVRISESEVCR